MDGNTSYTRALIANRLIEWLGATTSYPDLKENLDRTWPNYDEPPKWRRFYQHGPVLQEDEKSIHDANGKPTGYKLEVASVAYDHKAQPGDIIKSGNGRKYMVQPSGALKKI